MQTILRDGLTVALSDPVPVALADPGEKRWGFYQFPAISRLPDGRLALTFSDRPDRDDAYGTPGPVHVSSDAGQTWTPWRPDDSLLAVAHQVVSEIYDGQYLCAPFPPALDVKKSGVCLPELAGKMNAYGEVLFYRLSACSPDLQAYMATLPSTRWLPETSRWQRENIGWDTTAALLRTRLSDYVIPRPYLTNRLLKFDGGLLYADFYLQRLLPDGTIPRNFACWCMRSEDNGRTWRRHGLIAYDRSGALMMSEPCLERTTDGELVCAIRCAHHVQHPMLITRSQDGGRTWLPPTPLHPFGVMPQLLLLANGVLALTFGRPGVQLMVSADGTGRRWSDTIEVLPGDARNIHAHSCGYTRMVALGPQSLLLAYSDFLYPGPRGTCKAILVRRIELKTSG